MGLWLMVAGVVLIDAVVAWWVVIEYRRYRFRRAMLQVGANFREMQRLIGEALLPAVRDAKLALEEFARAFKEVG